MITIKKEQIDFLKKEYINSLGYQFQVALIKDGYENTDRKVIVWIINDAIKFGIKNLEHVYEYIKIAINTPDLIVEHKPRWARNILYSRTEPMTKINAIKRYLTKAKSDKN